MCGVIAFLRIISALLHSPEPGLLVNQLSNDGKKTKSKGDHAHSVNKIDVCKIVNNKNAQFCLCWKQQPLFHGR